MSQLETVHRYDDIACPNCGEPAEVQIGEVTDGSQVHKRWLIHISCSAACWENDREKADEAYDRLDKQLRASVGS